MTVTSRPKRIGKYDIIGSLGRGAMGVVYKGQDPQIGRVVAVKTLRKLGELKGAKRNKALERFKSEARSAGNLRHPNIITVFEANVEDQMPYIVMDHVQGESFDQVIARYGKLSPQATLYYMSQVAQALDYAHKQGVIHRDIKPGNLLLNSEGQMFVLDFGIAKISDSFLDGTGNNTREPVMGTPGYMSPEQILNKALDNRSDLFSFAIVIYECLSGKRPFTGKDYTEITENILKAEAPVLTNIAGISGNVVTTMQKALAKEREERFDSAGALIDALKTAFGITDLNKPENPAAADLANDTTAGNWQALSAKVQLANVLSDTENSDTDQEDPTQNDYAPVNPAPVLRRSPAANRRPGFSDTSLTHSTRVTAGPNRLILPGLVLLLSALVVVSAVYVLQLTAKPTPNADAGPVLPQNQGGTAPDSDNEVMNMVEAGKVVTELNQDALLETIKSPATEETLLLAALREAERRKLPDLIMACVTPMAHDSVNLRIEAARILGRTRDSEAVNILLPALDDYDPRVRQAAAEALEQIGSRKALSYLASSLKVEELPNVAAAIQKAINNIQGFENTPEQPTITVE